MNRDGLLAAMQPIHLLESFNYHVIALSMALILICCALIRPIIHKPLLRWRQQRLALSELARLKKRYDTDNDKAQLACGVSTLLRRYALVRFPDQNVAGLSGQPWLNFLDQHGKNQFFTNPGGSVLITAPYQRNLTIDVTDLLVQVHHWIKVNR